MPTIASFAVHAIELPFRGKFEHAAAARRRSESLFVELMLDNGITGWGEALPRPYVTGETRDSACEMLVKSILPGLLGRSFGSFEEITAFLITCNGQAPPDWVPPGQPQTAAWCAVDLALLDAFGKHFRCTPFGESRPSDIRYSGVLSAGNGWKQHAQLLAFRLLGFPAIKLKIDQTTTSADIARIRRLAGNDMDLRADTNMGWSVAQALERMPEFAKYGICSFEQPLAADDLAGAAQLVRETGLDVMADESLSTADSLRRLIHQRACTAINARISKCGGLIATLARCNEAHEARLWIQVGCQVGESSLLSAAHLHLCAAFREVRYAEGCFGSLLLADDPIQPALRMGRRGCPPAFSATAGLGIEVDRSKLAKYRVGYWQSGA